ncbi:16S rRNA (uracil(1498)-N(3))-methyltransferase [Hydrogenophaga sp. PAMC20947]|uniref:16S rRNA (uracil(1498)-N(3))-methyltransferase n=1 Tax=Hydrogenophaga sp. PAMC20947 TaxID=2565558 RepID=UPI00109D962C|nr:16S rRNA (uracil(1498)-N(3))-methyltransferase [Hydrogenophaga sp. PAMC20947]QCB47716.1 16S rRNA (uracil(1498)-N(3))-methyltransferase [Hydrogenophaga sp. PAMC20947]
MPRFHCPSPLTIGAEFDLPASAARHVQVLRLQPGSTITLFNGDGGEHSATVLRMGRSAVAVRVDAHHDLEREPLRAVHLAVGMPANDRMDWLVEKATELGVASIQPLHTSHSVLRLSGERALKKQAHWQSVAVAACEQCGANRIPAVHPVREFAAWLKEASAGEDTKALRCVLSLADGALRLPELRTGLAATQPILFLSGPEGGLSAAEDAQARGAGFAPVSLGPRVLRAETAALAALMAALAI